MVASVLFDGPQLPLFIIKKKNKPKKKIPVDGYDADFGSNEKILPPSRNSPEHQNKLM